jgi:hypothetical protein
VREVAGRDKKARFTALLHHIDVPLLIQSFYSLKRDAAPGSDGVTCQQYEEDLDSRIEDLHRRIHTGSYRATPVKRAFIPKTSKKRMRARLQTLRDTLVRGRHRPFRLQAEWLGRVVMGYFRYFAIPGNIPALESFRTQVVRYWLRALRRRSQKHRLSWEGFGPLVNRLIPHPRVLHAYPNARFYAKHPR